MLSCSSSPGHSADLAQRDTAARLGYPDKTAAARVLDQRVERLAVLQNRLWAEHTRSVLLVLQGVDASGKDGTIRRVFTGLNPQGCRVVSFKAPNTAELDRDYLWRIHKVVPRRGEIGIFNRSQYEDVVTAAMRGVVDDAGVDRRYQHIREFERVLVDEGTACVKVFLHISKDEQRTRFEARLADPEKRWKFRRDDLDTRRRWDEYMTRYDAAISATSTEWAPWHVVPADHKGVTATAVAGLLVEALQRLDPHVPPADPELDDIVVESR
ncbi:MAG: PPK2 family polyphosphate kinase [Actinomycetota bacterium]